MWQRFTPEARQVVMLATELAGAAGAAEVDDAHLLGAILLSLDCAAAQLLAQSGVVLPLPTAPTEPDAVHDRAFTEAVKSALTHAFNEARHAGQRLVDSRLLLFGLMQIDGPVSASLTEAGLTVEKLRETIRLEPPTVATEAPTEPPAKPTAWRIASLAQAIARDLHAPRCELHHLLLALVEEPGPARALLAELGVTAHHMRAAVLARWPPPPPGLRGEAVELGPPFGSQALAVVRRCDEVTHVSRLRLDDRPLLFALADSASPASELLESLGVTAERIAERWTRRDR